MGLSQAFTGHISFGGIDPDLSSRLRQVGGFRGDDRAAICIADSQAGRQGGATPTVDAAGSITVFTGYLFDPVRVAQDLSVDPQQSDTALAAAWLGRHGAEALADLPGDFALARWDPREARLVLAVAPLAGRMLYWHQDSGVVSFATSVAALHRIPTVPRELDLLQFTARFTARIGDPTRTVYQDVHLLPPGGMLLVDGTGCQRTDLWQPDLNRRLKLGSDGAYVEAARELLDRALANRLRTARSPAFLASGGLDSTAILSTAARQAGDRPIHSYTMIPPPGLAVTPDRGWYVSEQPQVEALAALYPHLRPRFCHSDGLPRMELDPTRLFLTSGLPCMIAAHLAWFDPAHQAIQRQGHDVVITGDMGNFTHSYDGLSCFSDLVWQGRLTTVARLLPQVAEYSHRRSWDIVRNHILVPLIPNRWADRYRRRRQGRHPLTRYALIRSDWLDSNGIDDYLQDHGEGSILNTFQDSRQQIVHFILNRRTASLQNRLLLDSIYGFQSRDVFADRDILEFCLAIPREQFIVDGRDRSLIRRMLQGRAPDCIVNEVRPGQQQPDWYSRMAPQREAFAADIDSFSQHPLLAEMMDLPRMRRLLDDWPAEGEPHEHLRLQYPVALSRAIHMGRFVRWATGSNR